MGSYDGAEICAVVGNFILSKLAAIYKRNSRTGINPDDGQATFEDIGPRTADKILKNFSVIFIEMGLNITVQAHLKVVNYVDITLNLTNGKYYPYRKPNNLPIYINTLSNHPPSIMKQLPIVSSNRLPVLRSTRI